MTERAQIEVQDNPSDHRYDVFVDHDLAGFAEYHAFTNQVLFFHTEIDPRYEGRGLGSTLARSALDDVRRQGKRVIPQCPFIAAYIRRHLEYADLVDEPYRARFLSSTA